MKMKHSCPYCQCGSCKQHKQGSGLTKQQKQHIVDICKRNPQLEEIGGLVLDDGTIIQETNHAGGADKRNTFQFTWDGKPAVGIWHRHLKKLGHDDKLSQPDIDAANQSGLSMYMVYDVGIPDAPYSSYKWAEYHPNGKPNHKPVRNYDAVFSCPTKEQLERIIKDSDRRIEKANKQYQVAVAAANKQIQQQQQQTKTVLDRAIIAATDTETRIEAIALKLQLLREENVPASQQHNHRHAPIADRHLRMPERNGTPAIEGGSQAASVSGWLHRKSRSRVNQEIGW